MYGGMLYFPLKVNLFEEIAVELVEARFGLKGTAAVMKLLCKIHKENGYYLKWNAEQCTLFTNKAGKDINEQEMQGIVDILVEKAFFDPKTYKEQGVLTSTEIQKIWLEATKRRKRDLTTLPYLLVETEEDKPDKDETCTQKRENCTQDADIFPENACNSKQSKESKVEESKAKESKALPPLTPPGKAEERREILIGHSRICLQQEYAQPGMPHAESGKALHHRPGGNQEDSEVIGLRQAGKLRLENIQWNKLEQGEQQGRVHHLGTGKGEAEYGKLIPQGTSYQ